MKVEHGCAGAQVVAGAGDCKASLEQGSSSSQWREKVQYLKPLGAPLLAVANKVPIHPSQGHKLSKWQQSSWSIAQVATSPHAEGCGVRTGEGLLVFDVDGETALSWLLEHGCDPATTKTWQIHRNTDENRFKVAFRLTPEQQQQFGNAKPKVGTKDPVKAADGTVLAKGEGVEVFHSTGGQVVVLGYHRESGGEYFWPDALEVKHLTAMPPAWWEAAMRINGGITKATTTKASSSREWRSLNPCPICSRNTTGYCSQHQDGKTIRCYQGQTFSPPSSLTRGELITGKDGQQWGYSQEQQQSNGDTFSVFALHDPTIERKSKTVTNNDKTVVNNDKTVVNFEDRWQLLEDHAAEIACSDWPVMKAVASLGHKASDLEVNRLTGRNLEQLLEQAHRAVRAKAEPVQGGGTFKVKSTPWAVDGLFRHGLNLLVGQSGAGKSRLASACMAAWLRGDATWLELPLNGIEQQNRHALIVGSDQTLEDWAITLEPVGLCKRLNAETVRIHPNLTLYGLETGVGLDADGLATIRRWVDHHPGGMVVVDSLSSCLPAGIDEDSKAAGRPVRRLQEVLGDAWGILTHHTRKGAGKEGNLGVGAGRGSGDIDAAVSRVIGLGLIHKMENGMLVAQESDDRRNLLSTKRGGKTLHLIVKQDGHGYWSNEGSAEALKQQERQERVVSNLTEAQSDALALLEATDGWLTVKDVVEGSGEEYEAKGAKAAFARKVLKRLEVLGVVESVRAGNERTYRAKVNQFSTEEKELTGSTGSPLATKGFSLVHQLVHHGSPSPGEPVGEPVAAGEQVNRFTAAGEPVGEPVTTQSPQWVNQLNHLPLTAPENTGSPTTERQSNEQRLKLLRPSADASSYDDDDLDDLVRSITEAKDRQHVKAVDAGLAIPEVA